MATQKWKKAPPEHVVTFDAALPSHPNVERRTMFGYACAFVNGNMIAGLHEDNICVRLGSENALTRIEQGAARRFAPMAGRIMKDYVAIPKADCTDVVRLKKWLEDALRYSLTLPPKVKKVKASGESAAAKAPRKRAKK